jgi:hypothetical protein
MSNRDSLNTPVAFFSMENGIYIIKIESEVVDPHSLYVIKSGLIVALRGKDLANSLSCRHRLKQVDVGGCKATYGAIKRRL